MKCINCNAMFKKAVRLSMLMLSLSIAVLLASCPMNQPNGGDDNNSGDSTLPVVSVSVSPAQVMEASAMDADRTLTFTVSVTPAPAEGRTLSVGLSPAVDKTAGTWSPTIAAGTSTELTSTQASRTYTFVASASDADIEDGTVSLTLQAGEGYTLKADAKSAQASVVDSRVVTRMGTANADTLTGADNVPETFVGAGGNDTINGGAGDGDIALYEQAGSFTISLASGTYTVASPSEGSDMLTGIETIRLSPMNDSVNSGITGITIDGGAGTDTIQLADTGVTYQIGSNDPMYKNFERVAGGSGADTITGGSEADTIDGGAGADTINGGAGADTLTGGTGADTFVIGASSDTITDFAPAEDKLDFSSIAANMLGEFDMSTDGSLGYSIGGTHYTLTLTGVTNSALTTSNFMLPAGYTLSGTGYTLLAKSPPENESFTGTILTDTLSFANISGHRIYVNLDSANDYSDLALVSPNGVIPTGPSILVFVDGDITVDNSVSPPIITQNYPATYTITTTQQIENIIGGLFADTLIGDAGPNRLDSIGASGTSGGNTVRNEFYRGNAGADIFNLSSINTTRSAIVDFSIPEGDKMDFSNNNSLQFMNFTFRRDNGIASNSLGFGGDQNKLYITAPTNSYVLLNNITIDPDSTMDDGNTYTYDSLNAAKIALCPHMIFATEQTCPTE